MPSEAAERDALLAVLFERNPAPMLLVVRASDRIEDANQAAIEAYGYGRDDLLSRTVQSLCRGDDAIPLRERLASSPHASFTSRWVKSDGAVVDVAWRASAYGASTEEKVLLVAETPVASAPDIEALRESEKRFRALVEHGSIGVALYRADGSPVYVNPAVTRVLGLTPEEMAAGSHSLHSHPDDLARIRDDYREMLRTPGAKRTLETRARHKDGSWRWIETVVTNLLHEPDLQGVVSNFRDVTDRKAAEAALKETRERLEFLIGATSAVTYTCRADGDFGATFMSDNVRTVLGYEPREFLECSSFWVDHIHPHDRPIVLANLVDLPARKRHTHEYRFLAKDGSWRWMHDELNVMFDESGKATELIGFWIDVTHRHQADEALRRSEANFRALTEQLPMGVLVHRDGHILYANPAFVTLLGYDSATDLVGRPPLELAHPDTRAAVQTRMDRTRNVGHSPPYETRVLRRDGTDVTVEMQGLLLPYDGAPANVVIAHDLTERREMMARLALTDRMLSVGTLAAGVAHEINNPLAFVVANLELLHDSLPTLLGVGHARGRPRLRPGDVTELLNDAREGASRMRAVVSDLRALSRADDARCGLVDLRAVIESSVKLAGNEIRHRARLVQEFEDVPPVMGNESRLGQVVLNVLLNAAQAIPDGHATENEIRLRLHRHGPDKVCIEIADTGCGIPSSIVGRIFDPFFTTKPIGVGTGLGLSICHGIVRSLGGDITVESVVGEGTTFRIVVPAAAANSPQVAVPRPIGGVVRRSRILAIDDEMAIGKSLKLLLAPDHDVTTMTRASDALASIEGGEHYDVILCDLMMPEMSGMELYSQLAQRAPQYLERIVFLTGGAFTATARAFLDMVPAPTLQKPFDLEGLRAAVELVVARGAARSS